MEHGEIKGPTIGFPAGVEAAEDLHRRSGEPAPLQLVGNFSVELTSPYEVIRLLDEARARISPVPPSDTGENALDHSEN